MAWRSRELHPGVGINSTSSRPQAWAVFLRAGISHFSNEQIAHIYINAQTWTILCITYLRLGDDLDNALSYECRTRYASTTEAAKAASLYVSIGILDFVAF